MIAEIDVWHSANELIKDFGDLADIEAAALLLPAKDVLTSTPTVEE
jgi:hypothetical protein